MNVKSKIIHVWPGVSSSKGCQNTAQKVVDGVTYITETVASICSQPTKMLSSYVADQIAPKYWRPNDQIKVAMLKKYIFIKILIYLFGFENSCNS